MEIIISWSGLENIQKKKHGKVQENNGEVCVYDVCEVLNYFKKFKTSEKLVFVNPLTMLKVR